jgi:hypothetical protein
VSRNVRLISRDRALGVDALAAHACTYVAAFINVVCAHTTSQPMASTRGTSGIDEPR